MPRTCACVVLRRVYLNTINVGELNSDMSPTDQEKEGEIAIHAVNELIS